MVQHGMISLIRKFPITALGLLFFLLPPRSPAQDRNLEYNILHSGDPKVSVQVSEHSEGNTRRIRIESLVQTRFLLKNNVKTTEEAVSGKDYWFFQVITRKSMPMTSRTCRLTGKSDPTKLMAGKMARIFHEHPSGIQSFRFIAMNRRISGKYFQISFSNTYRSPRYHPVNTG